ncbi:type III toxin-antitoxin system CptIN family toxin [Fusobacterium pseudoperiodonticum]
MDIKKNGFYLIKKEFFDKINDPYIPTKEKRPVFFCIQDKKNSELWWVIPMTSQLDKANKFIKKYGEEKCYKFEINTTMDKSVFNIQDLFPITSKYIDREFKIDGVHYVIKDKNLIKKVEKKASKVISMAMVGEKILNTSVNVQRIKNILEQEINSEKNKKLEVENIDINKSNGQITNYNCFTGEPINIENHSSGENKWIAKKDIEKFEIEKKEDAKEITADIYLKMSEKELKEYIKIKEKEEAKNPSDEEKLYQVPITYYNISDLKITKEIEKKFVPMKEKEKSQEIEKSKGQGIGD